MKTHSTGLSVNLKSLMGRIFTSSRIPQMFRFIPAMMVAFSAALFNTSAQDPLTNGLVAYYPFNGNANDESGNGNNGTVLGATLAVDRFGQPNHAYCFDGLSSYIKAAGDSLPSGPRTVSLWFWAQALDTHPVLLGYGGGCETSFLMGLNISTIQGFVVAHHCDTGFSVPYAAPPTNGWNHWVVSQNDSHIDMYLNGSLILSRDAPQGNTSTLGTDLAIGVAVSQVGKAPFVNVDVSFFRGLLDDIRIYDRELPPEEVQALYAKEKPQGVTSMTPVGGVISGKTWTKAQSPYLVTNDIRVATLTIEPGVTVLFGGSYVFEVDGRLTAAGSSNEMITFTRANCLVEWNGIFFNNAPNRPNSSKLAFCNISYSTNSGIRLLNSTPIIANCEIDSNSAPFGGGIWADIGTGDLTIEDTTIANNTAYIDSQTQVGGGGGISVKTYNNQLTLSHCTFTSNNVVGSSAAPGKATGGGINVEGNTALRTCFIAGNKCEGFVFSFVAPGEAYGGGVWSGSGQLVLEGCTIQNNTASVPFAGGGDESAYGGGINVASGSLAMTNCIIAGNTASAATSLSRGGVGGGIGLGKHRLTDGATTASIVNCTIAYNTPSGVAAVKLGDSSATLLNSIVYSNGDIDTVQLAQVGPDGTITATYSDVQMPRGLLFPGDGNIDSNPVFFSATDLQIADPSPCIDAGNPDPSYYDACFPPSLGGLRNDMGAYGGPGACAWGTEPNAPTIPLGGELKPQWGWPASTALFSVTAQATGAAPTYQWYKDAVLLGGQTANTLKLANLDTTKAGFYSVMISNDSGRVSATQPLYMFKACARLQINPKDCSLTISGPPGTYVLKYTTDIANTNFVTWTSLATHEIVGAEWLYTLTDCSSVGSRFYGVKRE